MSTQNLIIKNNENKELEISNFSSLNIELKSDSKLVLKIINFESIKNVEISAKVGQNAQLDVIFAEFSNADIKVKSVVDLCEEGASCNWKLATLSNNTFKKSFDISFNHLVGNTYADMDNYGVARDKSYIVFSGVNHILEGSKSSVSKQNAKIIVFDKEAGGTASPILRIDENDVVASHGAVVGQLNSDHMFYLMSRGLSKDSARKLITLGYLKPISVYFNKQTQEKIENTIMEAL